MKRIGFYISLFLVTVGLGGCITQCSHTPKTSSDEVAGAPDLKDSIALVYQSGRVGTIEPCGCTISPNGGLDREFNFLAEYRAKGPVVYVDGGDLYAPVLLKKGMTPKFHQERADAITSMLNDMGLDVFAPGPGDMLLGKAFLQKQKAASKAKWLGTSLVDKAGKHLFSPMEIVERGGVKFAFLSVTTTSVKLKDGMRIEDPRKVLSTWVPKAAASADYVVVLSQLGNSSFDEKILAEFPKVSIWIGNDPTINRETPGQPSPGQLLLDGHSEGYMVGALQIQHKSPLKAWFAPHLEKKREQSVKEYEAALKSFDPGTPEYKSVETRIENAKKRLAVEVPGSTPYSNHLVGLDEKRYGKPNALTEKIAAEKKRVASSAINAPAEH